MSKTFYITAAAAMFASVAAFAQTDKPAAAPDTTASAPADAAPSGKMHHHHHHGMRSAKSGGTDWDADKLNACMSNATPTEQQESCLKQASSS